MWATRRAGRSGAPDQRGSPADGSLALATGLVGLALLLVLPPLLSPRLGPQGGLLVAFGLVLAWLLVTRAGAGGGGCARSVFSAALAAAAGLLALPAWIAAIGAAGGALGLAPRGASPPLSVVSIQAGVAVLLAPLLEELLHRERLIPPLRRRFGCVAAVMTTSALFALPHVEPWSVLAAFLVGLALGTLLCVGGSTALCVGYHAGLNLGGLLCGVPPVRAPLAPLASALAGAALLWAAVGVARLGARRGVHLGAGRVVRGAALPAAFLCAAPAGADVLSWVGSFSLDPLGPQPPLTVTARGVESVNGSAGGFALDTLTLSGTAQGSSIVPITDPVVSAAGPVGLRLVAGAGRGSLGPFFPPASLSATQLTRSTLPLRGSLRLCLFTLSCSAGVSLELAAGAAGSTVGLGVGGLVVGSPYGPSPLSLLGAPWTVRTATLTATTPAGGVATVFSTGGAHGPLSFTGSTARSGGSVRLVSPVVVEARSAEDGLVGFGRLEIRFVPEPGLLAALVAGAAGLWAVRRRRSSRTDGH